MKTTNRLTSVVSLVLVLLLIAAACTSCAPKLTDLGATIVAEKMIPLSNKHKNLLNLLFILSPYFTYTL